MANYIMNIKTRKIHNGDSPCSACLRMAEASKQYFSSYSEAENFFEGDNVKGEFCEICFKEKPVD